MNDTHIYLTPDQVRDLGLKPDDLKGRIRMATDEPKARYPKVDPDTLPEGAQHGYLGEVEVYDPAQPGHSNTVVGKAPKGDSTKVKGVVGVVSSDEGATGEAGSVHD